MVRVGKLVAARAWKLIYGDWKDPYVNLSLALRSVMTPEVAQELTEAASEGVISWADWMRIGRKAGLVESGKKNHADT